MSKETSYMFSVVFDTGDKTTATSCKSCQKNGDSKFLDS